MSRPLTDADRLEAFRLATTGFQHAAERWRAAAARRLSDDQLAEMLRFEIGILGWRSGRDGLNVEFQGDSLKIWATYESTARTKYPPNFHGGHSAHGAAHLWHWRPRQNAVVALRRLVRR